MEYSFEKLLEDISIGRELDFKFRGIDYSITNRDNNWYFYSTGIGLEEKISHFEDKDRLVKFIRELYIEGIALEQIINKRLYEELYVY